MGDTLYLCPECPFNCYELEALVGHIEKVHENGEDYDYGRGPDQTGDEQQQEQQLKEKQPESEESKVACCRFCSFSSCNRDILDRHELQVHARELFEEDSQTEWEQRALRAKFRNAGHHAGHLAGGHHAQDDLDQDCSLADDDGRHSSSLDGSPLSRPKMKFSCAKCGFSTRDRNERNEHQRHCAKVAVLNGKNNRSPESSEPEDKSNKYSSLLADLVDDDGDLSPNGDPSTSKYLRRYDCHQCNFMTVKPKEFLIHKRQIHNEEFPIFECNLCDYASQYKGKVERHKMLRHRGTTTPITKRQPSIMAASPVLGEHQHHHQQLHLHHHHHHKVTPSKFLKTTGLLNSFKWKENKKVYSCGLCDYKTNMGNNMKRHQTHHGSKQPFKCHLCDYAVSSEAVLTFHLNKHHMNDGEPKPCSSPANQDSSGVASDGELVIDEGEPRPEVRDSDPTAKDFALLPPTLANAFSASELGGRKSYVCQKCFYTTHNLGFIKKHMIVHMTQTPWRCPYCASRYKRSHDLNRHLRLKHDINPADVRLEPVYDEDGPAANGAGAAAGEGGAGVPESPADSPADHHHHHHQHHHLEGEDPLPPSEEGVLGKITIEGSNRKYPVPVFVDRVMARNRHDGVSEFRCYLCRYEGRWRHDLTRHLITHTCRRTFKCRLCHALYRWRGDLSFHLRKRHMLENGELASAIETMFNKTGSLPEVDGSVDEDADADAWEQADDDEDGMHNGHDQEDEEDAMEERRSEDMAAHYGGAAAAAAADASGQDGGAAHLWPDGDGGDRTAGKRFQCSKCSYRSNYLSEVRYHENIHLPVKPFGCTYCDYRSNFKSDVYKHLQRKHPDEERRVKTFQSDHLNGSDVCSSSESKGEAGDKLGYDDGDDMDYEDEDEAREKRIYEDSGSEDETGAKRFRLDELSGKCLSKQGRGGPKPFKCSICGYRANWCSDVRRHLVKSHRCHPAEAYLVTMNKDEAWSTVDEYNRLFRSGLSPLTGNEPKQPGADGASTKEQETDPDDPMEGASGGRENLEQPLEVEVSMSGDRNSSEGPTRRFWKCPRCPYRHVVWEKVLRHIGIHSGSAKIAYRCSSCGWMSCSRKAVYKHLCKTHVKDSTGHLPRIIIVKQGQNDSDNPPSATDEHVQRTDGASAGELDKSLLCERCPFKARDGIELANHVRFHEQRPGATSKCPHCSYWVAKRAMLAQHLLLHGDRSLEGEELNHVGDIKMSLVNRSPSTSFEFNGTPKRRLPPSYYEKKFKCSKCPFRTYKKRTYLKHITFHGSKNPFKCKFCDYAVTMSHILDQHMVIHYQKADAEEGPLDLCQNGEEDDRTPLEHESVMTPQGSERSTPTENEEIKQEDSVVPAAHSQPECAKNELLGLLDFSKKSVDSSPSCKSAGVQGIDFGLYLTT